MRVSIVRRRLDRLRRTRRRARSGRWVRTVLGDLAGVAQSFRRLGLKGDAVKEAVPVLTNYIGKTSGGDLAKLLGESLR
jgi:Protein of unknown function VcgC/VcgE (DUF2780)